MRQHLLIFITIAITMLGIAEADARGFGGRGGGGRIGGGHIGGGGGMRMSAPHMNAPRMNMNMARPNVSQMNRANFGGARPNMGNLGGHGGGAGAGNRAGGNMATGGFGRNPFPATQNTLANLGLENLGFQGGHGFGGGNKTPGTPPGGSPTQRPGNESARMPNKGLESGRAASGDQLDQFLGLGGHRNLPGDLGMNSVAKPQPSKPAVDRVANNRPANRPDRPNALRPDRPGPDNPPGFDRPSPVPNPVSRPGSGPDPRRQAMRQQLGDDVRENFRDDGFFDDDWYDRYPNAWRPRRWHRGNVWVVWGWPYVDDWFGWGYDDPIYYDYGYNVIYQDNSVYVNGENVGTTEQYYDQVSELADAGEDAGDNEQWLPLGVFAMTHNRSTKANLILQLAVNRAGIIRGNYTATLTDHTLPVQGSVDKETQLCAWTIGDNKENVFETGIYNLTKDEVPILVHHGKDLTEQWTLVRLKSDDADASGSRDANTNAGK